MIEEVKQKTFKPTKAELTVLANQIKELTGLVDSVVVTCDEIVLKLPTLKVKFKK